MSYDVVVIGEILVELSTTEPLRPGAAMTLGFSGDALNCAAAAVGAGARAALLTRVATDELGDLIVNRLAELGIDTALAQRVPGENGAYFVQCDPTGSRSFVYARRGSAARHLSPDDVRAAGLETAGLVLASGVTCALSESAARAVLTAADTTRFVYDPNFRPRLTTARDAAHWLRQLARRAELVTPSFPAESEALLGAASPAAAATWCREAGAAAVAVTCGADGVWLDDGTAVELVPAVPAPIVVDQTGAGDVFAGTVAARLALGDPLRDAVALGTSAAALSLAGAGGCGVVPPLADTRAHLTGVTA